jgi:hypothetical protein
MIMMMMMMMMMMIMTKTTTTTTSIADHVMPRQHPFTSFTVHYSLRNLSMCVCVCACVCVWWNSCNYELFGRSQWPRRLRRGSAADHLLGSWVRIPLGAWMSLSCECLRCQVEVSATGRSLVQRSPTDCGVCLSVIK